MVHGCAVLRLCDCFWYLQLTYHTFFRSALVKFFRLRSVEFAMVTPSLPQWGRQPKGASPLDPHLQIFFSSGPASAPLAEFGGKFPIRETGI
ncbi:MAG: hypothetical protein A4E33_01653 [Methanoregula sp. PtaB.Bin085]|nr:MAG: hypothetical protein A4E33_01653 [Methanoregula sp. PtaB.Bin085]